MHGQLVTRPRTVRDALVMHGRATAHTVIASSLSHPARAHTVLARRLPEIEVPYSAAASAPCQWLSSSYQTRSKMMAHD
eukprot:11016537-Karenia_brevis.AAC.1